MKAIFDGFLLVTDLDGTLLNTDSEISEENKKAIEYFVSQGGQFTLATGRIVNSAYRFAKELPLTLPAILYNGARVYDYAKGITLEESYIEETIKDKIRCIQADYPNLGIQAFIEEAIHIVAPSEEDKYLQQKNYIVHMEDEVAFKKPWTKILMLDKDEEAIERLEEALGEKYGLKDVVRSGSRYLEIVPKGVSKGEKLQKLIKTYGIDPSKVIAAGDNMNDAHMLQVAAYGFAIENGSKRLIEEAKLIAPHNDKHSIAYIVNFMKTSLDTL